jgi:hypothetical protein
MMLSSTAGLYAARITAARNLKKDVIAVGPSNIQYDKSKHQFIIQFKGPLEDIFYSEDQKMLELYVRRTKIE